MWFISLSAALVVATAFGASAARSSSRVASVSVASDIPMPALDRLVTRLASEARGIEHP
jgi:hypothetical protein